MSDAIAWSYDAQSPQGLQISGVFSNPIHAVLSSHPSLARFLTTGQIIVVPSEDYSHEPPWCAGYFSEGREDRTASSVKKRL